MDMIQVLVLIGIAILNIGATIALFIWCSKSAQEDRNRISYLTDAIQQEITDFHGCIERLDGEFKAHLLHRHNPH